MLSISHRHAGVRCLATLVLLALSACGTDPRAPEPLPKDVAVTNASEVRALAERGDVESQLVLASMYFDGQGVPRDEAEARKWFALAAERHDPRGQYALGVMARDPVESARWHALAAEQGHASAQRALAIARLAGNGVAEDASEAARLLRLAADRGDAESQFLLGMLCAEGRGVERDEALAVRWWTTASDRGLAQAQRNLANAYAKGRGVSADPARAVALNRLAADQGLAEAQADLGLAYIQGRGVDADPAEGARWLALAAERGVAIAQGLPATTTCLFFQGNAPVTTTSFFGDGARCAGSGIVRLGTKTASAVRRGVRLSGRHPDPHAGTHPGRRRLALLPGLVQERCGVLHELDVQPVERGGPPVVAVTNGRRRVA